MLLVSAHKAAKPRKRVSQLPFSQAPQGFSARFHRFAAFFALSYAGIFHVLSPPLTNLAGILISREVCIRFKIFSVPIQRGADFTKK